jgi:multicomponent Na+:H+ antiporter subunit G
MIRLVLAAILVFSGLFVLGVAVLGIFRFDYVLNRIHAAAKCDTLGAFLILTGLMIAEGFSFITFKLLLIVVFVWLTNPVASHLICKTEVLTNLAIEEQCEVCEVDQP